jgi:hypothetical protein
MTRRRAWLLGIAAVLGAGALAGGIVIHSAGAENGGTALRSYNEVPSLSYPSATGDFRLHISDSAKTIFFHFNWSGLTGPPLFAHIHFGQVGVNGGVSAFLCGGSTKPACPQATSGAISGTITPDDVIGPAGQGIAAGEWDELVMAIRAGFTYANIHTTLNPGGEARGQISVSG